MLRHTFDLRGADSTDFHSLVLEDALWLLAQMQPESDSLPHESLVSEWRGTSGVSLDVGDSDC